ncbi:MAG: cytochrome c maturation protein CcmE [Anaerolineaceae bacterium]
MKKSGSAGSKNNRIKFIIGGGLFLVAVILMVISATKATSEFFMTVKEVLEAEDDLQGQNLRVSGAVIGDSIAYDAKTGELRFVIAHIPADKDLVKGDSGLSEVLHQAVNDPNNPRLSVYHRGSPPDMLRDEAQAILTGALNPEGVFIAEELLLKCPSKYEEALPDPVEH